MHPETTTWIDDRTRPADVAMTRETEFGGELQGSFENVADTRHSIMDQQVFGNFPDLPGVSDIAALHKPLATTTFVEANGTAISPTLQL